MLRACPSVVDYAPGRTIRHYAELRQVAELLRTFLGISPSAWETAIEVLGEVDAVLTIVMIHEKGESIRSAGGYLRQLTQKRRDGAYAVGPMLMALLNTQLRAQTAAAGSCHPEGATK